MTPSHLADYLELSAARYAERVAVVDPTGCSVTYDDLNRQADALAGFLVAHGVRRGDRVGVVLPKSIAAVAAFFGIMKAGAAYVPVDCAAPAERSRQILTDCEIRALIVDAGALAVTPETHDREPLAVIVVGGAPGSAVRTEDATPFELVVESGAADRMQVARNATDLAYILYTSGSTGAPKGVMITHRNVVSFLDWCSTVFQPTEHDRFASHVPFHFDPSVFDIYLSTKHGASLHLISEELSKSPEGMARFIAARQLTVWGSSASALSLLVQFGHLDAHDASSLRIVMSGGEPFPVKHLRELQRRWASPAYFNVYGPTETCVFSTFGRIPTVIPDDRDAPYPIGFPGPHCQALVLDADGRDVPTGGEGLLHISGAPVFAGYWRRPLETAAAFLDRGGVRWYNTGDVVRWDSAEGLVYLGRKDRMVKRRGYRIELGEIERALYTHARLREAAVVAVADADSGVKIVAFLCCSDEERPSIVELKTFCARNLPGYMNPDRFIFRDRLPRTSTDKVDYQALQHQLLSLPQCELAGAHRGKTG